ncbi:FAD-binding domain-containing protein [Lactarius psammicola]|nr:FAD-binding domain-containing protein [Lactarius psammicola]
MSHWASSSSQVSACSVEPGTPQDVGLIVITGGGYNLNRGFSSTLGVHNSLTRFNDIVINEDSETVEIGAGLTWPDMYASIVPKGINDVGGRLNGVGVSGHTLGGDTVTEYELVLPDGQVTIVTEQDEDLWFGLRGGVNNFGIVTKFTLKSHKQSDIWMDGVQKAFSKFLSEPHDSKAAQLGDMTLFYDGPEPQGLYDELLNLLSISKSIFEGSFLDLVTESCRGYLSSIPMLNYTEPIMNAFINETEYDPSVVVVYALDSFESGFLAHGSPSALPPDRTLPVFPSRSYYGWADESVDKYMEDAILASTATLERTGIQEDQNLENATADVNYARSGTPLERIYGGNLPRLPGMASIGIFIALARASKRKGWEGMFFDLPEASGCIGHTPRESN